MFTEEQRDRVGDWLLALASADQRVVAGAVVGGLALGGGDRWSDLDLTFAVADGVRVDRVLGDWTRRLEREHDAVALFDVSAGPSIYRVFLLPGCLQVDVSFTPAGRFGARGPRFQLVFGQAVDTAHAAPPSADDLFGRGVHHAVRARLAIERSRSRQAEYWIGDLRNLVLSLACLRRGLEPEYGRGLDRLPEEVLARCDEARPLSVDRADLLRALVHAVDALLHEGAAHPAAAKVRLWLGELAAPTLG